MLEAGRYAETYIEVGRTYRDLVPEPGDLLTLSPSIRFGTGSSGRRLAHLHDWLFSAPPKRAAGGATPCQVSGYTLRNVPIQLDRAGVLALGRRALAEGRGNPHAYQSWYVRIDGRRVAPKWLVSQVSGLAPSAFGSGEARRVLAQLGIEVERL